MHEVNPKAKAA